MKDNTVIIANSLPFAKCGYMKLRELFIKVPKGIMLMPNVKVNELPVGFGVFQIGMGK